MLKSKKVEKLFVIKQNRINETHIKINYTRHSSVCNPTWEANAGEH